MQVKMNLKFVVLVLILSLSRVKSETSITALAVEDPASVAYMPGTPVTVTVDISLTNPDDDPLVVTTVDLYLTNGNDLATATTKSEAFISTTLDPAQTVPAASDGVSGTLDITDTIIPNVECTADNCLAYTHVCVGYNGEDTGTLCIALGAADDEAGVRKCSDLAMLSFAVSGGDEDITYNTDGEVSIKATVSINNLGEVTVPAAADGEPDTFSLKVFFANGDDLEAAEVIKGPADGIAATPDEPGNLKLEYLGSGNDPASPSTEIQVVINATVPSDNCASFTHLCAIATIADVINNQNTTNDFRCLPLGSQPTEADPAAGEVDCSNGVSLKLNVVVALLLTLFSMATTQMFL